MVARWSLLLLFVACANSTVLKLSCSQVKELVDGHNTRRSMLARGRIGDQPAASNIKWMVWDDELATKATKWAANMKYQHNTDKTIPSGRFVTGENLYLMSSTNASTPFDVKRAMHAWWTEHEHYTFATLKSSDFGRAQAIGHYTQMAWANTTFLGCGASTYKKSKTYRTLLVCNYGPTGNVLKQKVYPPGTKGIRGTKAKKLTCDEGAAVCPPAKRYGTKC